MFIYVLPHAQEQWPLLLAPVSHISTAAAYCPLSFITPYDPCVLDSDTPLTPQNGEPERVASLAKLTRQCTLQGVTGLLRLF